MGWSCLPELPFVAVEDSGTACAASTLVVPITGLLGLSFALRKFENTL